MKNNTVQLHFSYRIGGVRIKVFQTGKGLRLKNPFNAASDVENLRGIHSHFTYEAFFVTEGKLELVTDRDTAVYERKIVIIPPKLRHYSFTSAKGSFCLLFTLEETGHTLQNTLDKGICTLEMEEDSAFYIIQAARKLEQQNPVAERNAGF